MINPVRLSTPFSPYTTKVMLLGAGELGKEIIIALQRLGVEIIAVDRYPNTPGQQVAHHAHVIDMANSASLAKVIAKEQPDLILPEIEGIATQVLLEIERTGKTRIIPTARAAWLSMNRERIRRLASETLKLNTSPYRFANNLEELHTAITQIKLPCIIKPVISSSGKGQSKIESMKEINTAWQYAKIAGRVNAERVIIEGFIDFDYEITLLTIRSLNKTGNIITNFCEPIGHIQINGDYVESWQPHEMHPIALEKAKKIALTITSNLGGLGLFGVELFVKKDVVWFSEISPRPHDTGIVTIVSQLQNEFELHAKAVLGLPINTTMYSPGASTVIYGQHDAKAIAFNGVEDALHIPNTEIYLFGKPESFRRRRMGVALAWANNVDTARSLSKQAAAKVKPVKLSI